VYRLTTDVDYRVGEAGPPEFRKDRFKLQPIG